MLVRIDIYYLIIFSCIETHTVVHNCFIVLLFLSSPREVLRFLCKPTTIFSNRQLEAAHNPPHRSNAMLLLSCNEQYQWLIQHTMTTMTIPIQIINTVSTPISIYWSMQYQYNDHYNNPYSVHITIDTVSIPLSIQWSIPYQ